MTPPIRTARARRLRRDGTKVEAVLWRALRGKAFAGWKFRRQHAVGRYIVDFACPAARLAIELDGGQHDWSRETDARRTAEIERAGYRVLRFWNSEVSDNLDGVLSVIADAMRDR